MGETGSGVKQVRASVLFLVSCVGLMAPDVIGLGGAAAEGAGAPEIANRSQEWQLARGGRIYDNWFAAQLAEPPLRPHPMLPAGSDVEPASSWRCSTCHGWDYRGSEIIGTAGTIKPPSLEKMRGVDVEVIAQLLRAEPHGYSPSLLPEQELRLVAHFVSEGQHDITAFADAKYVDSTGDPLSGRPIYQGVCISCHDSDGRAYIEGEPGDEVSLGWLSRNRTTQVLHKIRNGQPGTDMVQLRFLSNAQISDLLAYLQTLPDP